MKHGWIALGAMATLVACAPDQDMQEETADSTPETAAPMEMAAMPDTTAAALWAYLQEQNYRSWALWPGKGELYAGGEPHGMLLTTYVNRLAQEALPPSSAGLPADAIIVKENYMPDSTLAAITVMWKVTGYAPETGNWFWAKYTPDGSVDAAGRVGSCTGCHSQNATADYLMTLRSQ